MSDLNYAVFNKTESVLGSIAKDLMSLAVITLLIYVSQGSKWWTLVTGLMFIFWVGAKFSAITTARHKTFKTKADLIKWAESLPDDSENSKRSPKNPAPLTPPRPIR